ncbi:hypothetical protein JCM3765_007038 [Sporobolomyces pararoseus]
MSGLDPWLARVWEEQRSEQGCTLSTEPLTSGKRLQYVQSLAETEEDGEKLIWVRMGDTELIIDVCVPSKFVNEVYNVLSTSFTSSGAEKPIFKLRSWRFVLACPPNPAKLHQNSTKSTSIVETLPKRVCLRIDQLEKFGDTDGQIIKALKAKELVDFRKIKRVEATVDAVEHPEERQAQVDVAYADDLPRFATQPEAVAAPIPGPSNHRLSFAAPAPTSTAAPRKSTSTSTSSSSSSSFDGFDWSLVAWPPQDIDYSKRSRPDGELEELWHKKKAKRVERWKGKGKRIDPLLEQSLTDEGARITNSNLVVASAMTEVEGPKGGGGGGGGGGRKSSKEKEREKQKRRSTSSRPRQLPTPTSKTSLAGTSSVSTTTSASTSNVQGKDKQKRTELPDSSPPVDAPSSPSQRASQNSQTRSQQRSQSRPQSRSKAPSSQPKSITLDKGKEKVKEIPEESDSDGEVEAEKEAMVPWDDTPTPETLALAQAQAQVLAERKKQEKQEATERIRREQEKDQLQQVEESDSEKEEDVVAQTLLSQQQYSQNLAKKSHSSSPVVLKQTARPSTSSNSKSARALLDQAIVRSVSENVQPHSSSRRQTQQPPHSSAPVRTGTQSSLRSLTNPSLPDHASRSTQQQEQVVGPSSFPLPTAAQHLASLDPPTSSAWNAALGDGDDLANATAESISLTQQEEGFPKGGQQHQHSGTFRVDVLRENTSSGSTVTSLKRRKDKDIQGKENDGDIKKKKKTVDSEKIEKRKKGVVQEEKKEETAVLEKKKVEKRDLVGSREGREVGKDKNPEQTVEGVTLTNNKKRPPYGAETVAEPNSSSPEQARQSKKPRHGSPRNPPPNGPAPPPAPRSRPQTQIQRQTQPRLSTASQGSLSQNPAWNNLVASLSSKRTASPEIQEHPIETMRRLREKRKRNEAILAQTEQSLM